MLLHLLRRDESGTTAIEYGLLASLIGASIILAVGGLGVSAETLFGTIPPILSAFQGATGP
jgi:pilus assembly protein Flp/PilA